MKFNGILLCPFFIRYHLIQITCGWKTCG